MDLRFAADRTVGKLAKWMRILGFDTIFESDLSSHYFYHHLDPGRIILTRMTKIGQRSGAHRIIFVVADDVQRQLRQVVAELAISREDICPFSICLRCNATIMGIDKELVSGLVPDYIWQTHDNFSRCQQCERIYWAGSHSERTMAVIERLFKRSA